MKEKISVLNPWFSTVENIYESLKTNNKGLSSNEAKERLEIYGPNNLRKNKSISVVDLAIKQFISPLIFILIAAAILTALLKEWVNMAVIIAAVLVNTLLGLYREYQAENTLEKLVTYIKDRSRVIRDKNEQEIDSSLLVPGDIIKLSYGSRIPADARLISVNNFKVDEAILTGESIPETKQIESVKESSLVSDRTNMVYAGTLVVEGFGEAVVINTGENTEIGKIAKLVAKSERAITPIQKGVNKLSWYIFTLTMLIVVLIFILGISKGEPIIEMMILAAAVAVGAVPESLPIALTVILSVGVERIAKKNGIIRKLAAAETLGSTTLIMTDKTGTLTKAEMKLVGIYSLENILNSYFDKENLIRLSAKQKEILELSLHNIDVIVSNPNDIEKKWDFTGKPFEVNIAKIATMHNIPIRNILIEKSTLVIPFNSSNKYSVSKSNGKYIVMGAPDILLDKTNIDKDEYLQIKKWIKSASENGNRLISVCTLNSDKKTINNEDVKELNFEGIFSFFDPIREDVKEAILNIENHGVKVVMITGDLKGTAISVAKDLGWEIKNNQVLTAEDLHTMTDEQILDVINNIKIYARVTPEDKLRIGNLYRSKGEIVAMTGDGVNDSPALKTMDIGISLGSGSDVAQSVADLVLLDDNFQTISMAIDEGRRILANIRKTFIYLMSNSLDEVFVISGSLIANIALPLSALQIIWVNLFTGSLPALAFAYDENLDKSYVKNKNNKELLNKEVKILSFGIGAVSSILIFFLYYILIKNNIPINEARSVFFVCFSVYVLVVSFSFRSLYRPIYSYNPFSNKKLNYSILIALSLLIITMTSSFMRNIFEIETLSFSWIWLVVFWAIFNIILVEIAKYIFRYKIRNTN